MRLVKLLDALGDGHHVVITRNEAIHVRDYIMLMLAMVIAARSSNLKKITLKNYMNAENEEYVCYLIRNSHYKTSFLYGDKLLSFI